MIWVFFSTVSFETHWFPDWVFFILVPLVVIQGDQLHTLDWSAQLAANKDRSSHYNIFPTLLQLMGVPQPPEMTGRSLLLA